MEQMSALVNSLIDVAAVIVKVANRAVSEVLIASPGSSMWIPR